MKHRCIAALISGCLLLLPLGACSPPSGTPSEGDASASSPTPTRNPELEKLKPAAKLDETAVDIGLCVIEALEIGQDNPMVAPKRFELYKELGIRTIRVGVLWGAIERKEGEFTRPLEVSYLQQIKKAGLRVKLSLGAVSVVPDWLMQRYPDAYLINEEGKRAVSSVTYLMPELREKLDIALDNMLKFFADEGVLDIVDIIGIDMGPAGEPLYPPNWTQVSDGLYNPPSGPEHFWMYDPYMQADFKRAMQEKYGTIEAANEAWGQHYASFEALTVPMPETVKGAMWNDVLTWYRDVKRRFMEENVQSYLKVINKYAGDRVKLMLYVPGADVRDEEWAEAVESGSGSNMIRLMADSRFIIDMAAKYDNCYLQYTGADNITEVRYLRNYMKEKGCEDIPFIGENSGALNMGQNIKRFTQNLMREGMSGIDIAHNVWLHEKDGYSPNKYFDSLKENLGIFSDYLKRGME